MEGRVNVGAVWGIPIGLHFSWLFVFGLVTWSLAGGYFPAEYPGWAPGTYWLVGAVTSLVFFGSILVRHLKKYSDAAVRPEHAFLFRAPDGRLVASADSLNAFRRSVATAADAVLAHHAGRHDFSRWIRDAFSDPELAAQLRKAERRWSRGDIPDLRRVIDELIAVRYWSEES